MKRIIMLLFGLCTMVNPLTAQITGSFTVQGDPDKFYPVTFSDGGWSNNVATELSIGRSSVHTDATWKGSVIAKFRYHVTNWGNECSFIDADVKQFNIFNSNNSNTFIAGWQDVSLANTSTSIIIWLKGGGTTYYYQSNYAVTPTVYDNSVHALPYQESNGPAHSYKTAIEGYVNNAGQSYNYTAYFNGTGRNYFKGSVGIGTLSTNDANYKLFVEGAVRARKVRVDQSAWPDYVFLTSYRLRPLTEVEQYIQQHQHLPEVPSAAEVEKEGIELGDNQSTLLKKIEELTLYLIDQNKKLEALQKEVQQLRKAKDLSGN